MMSNMTGVNHVEIRQAKGKGLGLFAIREIPKGTRILEEHPLVILPPSMKNSEHLWKRFETMTELQRVKFCDLSYAEDVVSPDMKTKIHDRLSKSTGADFQQALAEEIKMRAIFQCNCVAMGTSSQWGIGVFEFYSRINHSCTPNVHNSYNPTLHRETVHAVRDIRLGEEVLTSYTANTRRGEDRRQDLRRYGFECNCPACHGPEANAHEARRRRIFDIDQSLALLGMDGLLARMLGSLIPGDEDALQMAMENVSLLIEEGLLGMDLAVGYRDCSKLSLKQGKLDDALRYARLEREVELYCLGTETEYMKGDDQYAFTRMQAVEVLQTSHGAANSMLDNRDSHQTTGDEKQQSRSARRAQARAAAKAAKVHRV